MRILLIIAAIISLNTPLSAQDFAVINDRDGFVNVRQNKSASSKIVGKLFAITIFNIDLEGEKHTDWVRIYSAQTKGVLEGYVKKSHIISLSSFKHSPAQFSNSNYATFKSDSLDVKVTTANFVAKKHKLTQNKSSGTYYEKIDDKPIWGTDGNLPKKAIAGLSIKLNNKILQIPRSALSNLYEPNLGTLTIYFGTRNTLYIRMDNSDGAGAYTVIWTIKNGKYLNRFLDNSEA